jgi:hypothetical protein
MPNNSRGIYGAAWLLTVLMLLIDLIWAHHINFRVDNSSAIRSIQMMLGVVFMTGLLWAVSRRPYKSHARKLFYENVARLFMWITLLVAFTHVCVVFQYLCVATHFPLVSNALISIDAAMGFHWLETYRWVNAHHWVRFAFALAYASGGVQLFVIPIVLALTSNSRDYAEFVVQFMVSATVVIVIAVFFPTESAFLHFNVREPDTVSTVTDYVLLRRGTPNELAFGSAQGLISFPSLHRILGLCFAYSLRHVRFVFPIGIVLNTLMIIATPTQGGHYLFDVLSGLVIGIAVIYCVRRVFIGAAHSEVDRARRGTAWRLHATRRT